MEYRLSFGNIQAGVSPEVSAAPLPETAPFLAVIVGDFSGRANRGVLEIGSALSGRRLIPIDRDNFDDVLANLDVRLGQTLLDSTSAPVAVSFRELEDFHPDRLYETVELFESLRRLRRQLQNGDTFDQAAREVRSWATEPVPSEGKAATASAMQGETSTPRGPSPYSTEGLFDASLDQTERAAPLAPTPDWNALIRDIVAPYSQPKSDPQQAQLVGCVDAATARALRVLLHHPHFQELESAWRGLYLLVRRLQTDSQTQVLLLDLSKAEMAADLSGEDLTRSGLYRLLVERTVGTPGARRLAVIAGLYTFGPSDAELELLGRMAQVAAAAGAPFVATASGTLAGCPRPDQTPDPEDWPADAPPPAWSAVQSLPAARYASLLWPRFLVRLPYGRDTSPMESFAFEEFVSRPQHDELLWGSPALLAVLLLGQSYGEAGWRFKPGYVSEVSGLPLLISSHNGPAEARPCGELLLREQGLQRLKSRGITPVLSVQNRDEVRIPALLSLTGQPLAGPWRG